MARRITEVITPDVVVIQPQESVERAAQLMAQLNVGSLPVHDGDQLLGIVTDRDITVRAVAAGLSALDTPVSQIMSRDMQFCSPDDSVDDVERQMGEAQVRRLPVLNRAKELVGIVSLGDLATRQAEPVGAVLREISAP